MFKRAIMIAVLAGLPFIPTGMSAQTNCGTKLYCLIPTALHTTSSPNNSISSTMPSELKSAPHCCRQHLLPQDLFTLLINLGSTRPLPRVSDLSSPNDRKP